MTREEEETGWRLLFNGKDLSGWRIRDSAATPTGWVVRDSSLSYNGKGPTSILSTESYGDFELTMDWKVGIGDDAGIYLRVWNEKAAPSRVSPEVQLVDNLGNVAGMEPKQSAGACTHLYPPAFDAASPLGQWNHIKVTAVGKKVTHWLNERKVVEYEIGSEDWKNRLARSSLKDYPDLGTGARGYVGLQQVSTSTRFRNLKIRPLGLAIGVLARGGKAAVRPHGAGMHGLAWMSSGDMVARDLKGRAFAVQVTGK